MTAITQVEKLLAASAYPLTTAEMGKRLSLSPERVRQAIKTLREEIQPGYPRPRIVAVRRPQQQLLYDWSVGADKVGEGRAERLRQQVRAYGQLPLDQAQRLLEQMMADYL